MVLIWKTTARGPPPAATNTDRHAPAGHHRAPRLGMPPPNYLSTDGVLMSVGVDARRVRARLLRHE